MSTTTLLRDRALTGNFAQPSQGSRAIPGTAVVAADVERVGENALDLEELQMT